MPPTANTAALLRGGAKVAVESSARLTVSQVILLDAYMALQGEPAATVHA